MRGPTRFTWRTYQRDATWMLPQSTESYSRLAITNSSDSPRVYQCGRASGEGVTEAAEPERSVVPQYLALGVSPLRDIWEG